MAKVELFPRNGFFRGAPPRIMGTEAENLIHFTAYKSKTLSENRTPRNQERIVLNRLLSRSTFKKAGINATLRLLEDFWLANGARLYRDGYTLEYRTPERRGPKGALAETLRGI